MSCRLVVVGFNLNRVTGGVTLNHKRVIEHRCVREIVIEICSEIVSAVIVENHYAFGRNERVAVCGAFNVYTVFYNYVIKLVYFDSLTRLDFNLYSVITCF